MIVRTAFLTALIACAALCAQGQPTYAEKLGWPTGTKVVIFHVDDAGMSHDSNEGTIDAIQNGVASSTSIMMPCPWVAEMADHVAADPTIDAGVHLTLTAEWSRYRWEPLQGKPTVPNLVDPEGCLWPSVGDVVSRASVAEVDSEIRAQVQRCFDVGITPTHLDSHMGTLFSHAGYAQAYVDLGIELGIPVLAAAGHLTYVSINEPGLAGIATSLGEKAWTNGLPVIDDICTSLSSNNLTTTKANIISFLQTLSPGITEVILHCTRPSENFQYISASGPSREADTLAMLDADVAQAIIDEGIVLTTWRELTQRRNVLDGDGDGITDHDEIWYDGVGAYNPYDPDTNPTGTDLDTEKTDTDGDGTSDSDEIAAGTDPLNPADAPSPMRSLPVPRFGE
ncbi:MAG: ChbG/HpnK family deacetylase [bacterium]|nr:ChbG/HpnK family deacetylase [bacterium]